MADAPKRPVQRGRNEPVIMAADLRKKIESAFPETEPTDKQITEFLKELNVQEFKQLNIPFGARSFAKFKNLVGLKWVDGKIVEPTKAQLQSSILQQMEFYFSDGNLPRDKFLQKEVGKTSERWVSIELFMKFRKIQNWTTDLEFLTASLSASDFLDISEDKKSIRRKMPCTLTREQLNSQTTLVKKIPRNHHNEKEIRDFFSNHGTVIAVFTHRAKRDEPVGDAEVIWDSPETAKEVGAKKGVMWGDKEIFIKAPKLKESAEQRCQRYIVITEFSGDWRKLKTFLVDQLQVPAKFIKEADGNSYVKLDNDGMLAAEAAKLINDATAQLDDKKLEAALVSPAELTKVDAIFRPSDYGREGKQKQRQRKQFRKHMPKGNKRRNMRQNDGSNKRHRNN